MGGQGLTVKAIFIAGLGAALLSSSTYAQQTQVVGQPVLRAPAPMAPEDLRSHPNFGQPASKLPRAARAPSTPRSPDRRPRSRSRPIRCSTRALISESRKRYSAMPPSRCAAAGRRIPADAKLAPGASGPEVALLRKRLVISDDLAPELEAGDSYDVALVDAIKHFQLRHLLEANGSIGPQTLRTLNVPVAARIKQLEASLERLLGMDFVFAERYVVVNIPAAFVEAVAHDKVERRYRVIVGKVDKPSPTLTAYITAVNLNPTWTVPLSITKNEIIRHMRRDPSYLSRMHMRVLGARDEEISPQSVDWSSDRSPNFTIRQELRRLQRARQRQDRHAESVFGVHARHDVEKFVRRRLSFRLAWLHAVDNVRDLAAWVLQDTPGWSRAAIDAGIAAGHLKVINLPHRIPVAWVYVTGWVTRDGTVNFREDVYKHDDTLDRDALADVAAGWLRRALSDFA